jgi:preprotein translocase subunit SecY
MSLNTNLERYRALYKAIKSTNNNLEEVDQKQKKKQKKQQLRRTATLIVSHIQTLIMWLLFQDLICEPDL